MKLFSGQFGIPSAAKKFIENNKNGVVEKNIL